jgi:hypothetical protein
MNDTTPAHRVVSAFGGIKPVCEILRVTRVQVWRWSQPKPKGHGGQVPARHHEALLQAARERGAPLSARDLMPWLSEAA